MNREKLQDAMETAPDTIHQESVDYILTKHLDADPLYIDKPGTRNLVIVMEELAELQQQISKYLRGKRDKLGIIEEVADVYLALRYVELICNIPKPLVHKAMNVKLDRVNAAEGTYK